MFLALLMAMPAWGQVLERNVAELIDLAQDIVVARIIEVSDGISPENVPYTEIMIEISRTLKGRASGIYSFRQFGLLKPRDLGNGMASAVTTPPGWPAYEVGEETVLFLYRPARITGLRTTVGLRQGKMRIADGRITAVLPVNRLFRNVSVPYEALDPTKVEVLRRDSRTLDAVTFLDFVENAVREGWFSGVAEQ